MGGLLVLYEDVTPWLFRESVTPLYGGRTMPSFPATVRRGQRVPGRMTRRGVLMLLLLAVVGTALTLWRLNAPPER